MEILNNIKNGYSTATTDVSPNIPVFSSSTLSAPPSAPSTPSTTAQNPFAFLPPVSTAPATRKKVAVMGGGIGGLAAAKELAEKGFEVTIFEASNRLGGHIHTDYNSPIPGQYVERGGELIDADNKTMLRLCEEMTKYDPNFKVEVEDRRPDEHLKDMHFAEGRQRSEEEVIAAYKPLADYIARDQKQLRDANKNYTAHAQQIDALNIDQYLAKAVQDIKAQQGIDVPPWIVNLITRAYGSECGQDCHNMSALNLVDFIGTDTSEGFDLFGGSDETYRIKGGNSRLVQALEKYLGAQPNVKIYQASPITGLQETPHGVMVHVNNNQHAEQFDYAVSAMPLHALRNVQGVEALWHGLPEAQAKQAQSLVQNTQYTQLSKIVLETHGKPWGANQYTGTINNADDPICQTSWVGNDKQAGDTPNSNGMVTFLVGGSANQQKPAELIAHLKTQYARALGKSVDEVFTGKLLYQDWTKNACYVSPAPGQYTNLPIDRPLISATGRISAVGSYLPTLTEQGLMMGFMDNAAKTGCQAAEHIVAHSQHHSHTPPVSHTPIPQFHTANTTAHPQHSWVQNITQPQATIGPVVNNGQGFAANYTQQATQPIQPGTAPPGRAGP